MNSYQNNPLKLYIQDIFRANKTEDNKYVYELFGLTFKNVMIHGVVTSVYNSTTAVTNLELSDPTGTVQIYYDTNKCNSTISVDMVKELSNGFTEATMFGDENILVMSMLMDCIFKKKLDLAEGAYLSVIGDIFVDDKNYRMISAFDCKVTSAKRDVVWLEELRYLYEKFYLWNKE